jgi:hypothetical protein
MISSRTSPAQPQPCGSTSGRRHLLAGWLATAPARGEPLTVEAVLLAARGIDEVAAAAQGLQARLLTTRVLLHLEDPEAARRAWRLVQPESWAALEVTRGPEAVEVRVEGLEALDAGEVLHRLAAALGLRPGPAVLRADLVTGPDGGAPEPLSDPALAALLDRGGHTVAEPRRVTPPDPVRLPPAALHRRPHGLVLPGRPLPREGLDLDAVATGRWTTQGRLDLLLPSGERLDLDAERPLPAWAARALLPAAAVRLGGEVPASAHGVRSRSAIAAGVVVHADPEAVPGDLRASSPACAGGPPAGPDHPLPDRLDPDAWGLRAVGDRRAAVLARGLSEPAAAAVTGAPLRWPTVSVVLSTRRPDLVAGAVAAVAAQHYPAVELVLVLHGEGFDPAAVEAVERSSGRPTRVVPVAGDAPVGVALAAGTEAASGALLAKMDDDDTYGPWHLTDLVLAQRWSGADVVGKAPALVHLRSLNAALWFGGLPHECDSFVVAGGSVLLDTGTLQAAGGWAPARRGVDTVMLRRVQVDGGRVHATHPYGFVLVRSDEGHTWRQRPAAFAARAAAQWRGGPPATLVGGE